MRKLVLITLIAAATLSGHAGAQTASTPALEVQRLAPQLIAFAGGDVNFQNLANGLAFGLPVTLTSAIAPGQTQVVTFTPTTTMTPLAIAQSLEAVRQQLIALGVASPNAAQLGVALVGGTLSTAAGSVPLSGVVRINGPLASSTFGQPTSASFLPGISTTVAPRNTSDTPFVGRNTSDSPFVGRNTSDSATVGRNTSDSPTVGRNTSDSPGTTTGTTTGTTSSSSSGGAATGGSAPAAR